MSKADDFRQYAEEAIRWAYQSKTEKNKLILLDLARTWTQAAVHSESVSVVVVAKSTRGKGGAVSRARK
jgi:hypothetical protein